VWGECGRCEQVDPSKLPPPEAWRVAEARALFEAPAVVDAASLSLAWTAPDEAGLRAFLIERHSFFEQLSLY